MALGADVFKRHGHRFLPESPVMIRSDCLRGSLIKEAPYGAGHRFAPTTVGHNMLRHRYEFSSTCYQRKLDFLRILYVYILHTQWWNLIPMFSNHTWHLGHLLVKVMTFIIYVFSSVLLKVRRGEVKNWPNSNIQLINVALVYGFQRSPSFV